MNFKCLLIMLALALAFIAVAIVKAGVSEEEQSACAKKIDEGLVRYANVKASKECGETGSHSPSECAKCCKGHGVEMATLNSMMKFKCVCH